MAGENRKQRDFRHVGLAFREDGVAGHVLSTDGRVVGKRTARKMSATTPQQKAYLEKNGFPQKGDDSLPPLDR